MCRKSSLARRSCTVDDIRGMHSIGNRYKEGYYEQRREGEGAPLEQL